MYFQNREDAANRLCKKLLKFRRQRPVVFALPRGGIVLGKIISQKLKAPLDLIIPRKIGHPLNTEYAIGAISEAGKIIIKPQTGRGLKAAWLNKTAQKELAESRRRRKQYWQGRGRIPATSRVCIVVDDGMATGLTMEAAIQDLAAEHPKSLIIAVPVAPQEIVNKFQQLGIIVISLLAPQAFLGSISAYYENFPQLTDQEVVDMLKESK